MQGPELNKRLEPRTLTTLAGTEVVLGGSAEKPTLVLYTSVRCPACRELVGILPTFVARFQADIKIVMVCHGEQDIVSAMTQGLPQSVSTYADIRGELTSTHRLFIAPYAFVLDENGIVREKGVPAANADALALFVSRLVGINNDRPAPARNVDERLALRESGVVPQVH